MPSFLVADNFAADPVDHSPAGRTVFTRFSLRPRRRRGSRLLQALFSTGQSDSRGAGMEILDCAQMGESSRRPRFLTSMSIRRERVVARCSLEFGL